MTLLTELSVLYEQSKNLDRQNCVVDEMEKIDAEYSNIINQAKEYLYNQNDESSSITGTGQSKVRRLQQDEIDAREKIKEIEKEFKQKQEELELQRTELEEKYKIEMQVLDDKLASEGKKFELSKKGVLDIPEANSSCDLDSVKSEQIHDRTDCRIEIQLERSDVNKELSTQKIGQDFWRQLKRVLSIPLFNGDKRNYENRKSAFSACVDQTPATPKYELLQLRQYLSGEAVKAI